MRTPSRECRSAGQQSFPSFLFQTGDFIQSILWVSIICRPYHISSPIPSKHVHWRCRHTKRQGEAAMANDYSRAARDEKTCRARAIENRIQHQSLAHIAIHAEENDKRKNRNAPVGSINLSKLKRRCCCHLGDAHFD